MKKIKYWLWKRNLYQKCPDCSSELIEHGFDRTMIYTCSNKKCDFGKK